MENFKSGFISILGRPNAGKSTLLNRIIGEKVSIVSKKPQTTRDKITGILNGNGFQMVFADTPGIHKGKNKLSEYMMKNVESALEGIDAAVYVIACDKPVDAVDERYLVSLSAGKTPLIVALNKCDAVEKTEIVKKIELISRYNPKEIVPLSAATGKNCDELLNVLKKLLPSGERYFPEDMFTDKSIRYMCSEIIREKALRLLGDEVPFGVGVEITRFDERADGLAEIEADLVADKKAHKPIIIGRGGEKLKRISTEARQEMEKLLDCRVFLRIFVKVREQWRDDNAMLDELGYNKKDV